MLRLAQSLHGRDVVRLALGLLELVLELLELLLGRRRPSLFVVLRVLFVPRHAVRRDGQGQQQRHHSRRHGSTSASPRIRITDETTISRILLPPFESFNVRSTLLRTASGTAIVSVP